eukprot:TRINITY_DN6031_c0_g1_i1.p1 TRINITY_DN6031_c0_g1~~TRINITY_DN6031_c0_g1_i1.p1  ORF type:complete len:319 (-),score=88.30 TRINITY_DN6031_c0_g1_i1:134-1090(-)
MKSILPAYFIDIPKSFLVKRLIVHCDGNQLADIAYYIRNSIDKIATHYHGSRLLEGFIQRCYDHPEALETICKSLVKDMSLLANDSHGSHIVQIAIRSPNEKCSKMISDSILDSLKIEEMGDQVMSNNLLRDALLVCSDERITSILKSLTPQKLSSVLQHKVLSINMEYVFSRINNEEQSLSLKESLMPIFLEMAKSKIPNRSMQRLFSINSDCNKFIYQFMRENVEKFVTEIIPFLLLYRALNEGEGNENEKEAIRDAIKNTKTYSWANDKLQKGLEGYQPLKELSLHDYYERMASKEKRESEEGESNEKKEELVSS